MSPDKGKSLQITALKASSAHVKIDTLAPLATLPGRMSPDKGPRMLPSLHADNVLTSRNEYARGSTHYRESGAGGRGRGGGGLLSVLAGLSKKQKGVGASGVSSSPYCLLVFCDLEV